MLEKYIRRLCMDITRDILKIIFQERIYYIKYRERKKFNILSTTRFYVKGSRRYFVLRDGRFRFQHTSSLVLSRVF